LAYEVARQFRAQGEEVAGLALVQTVMKGYPKIRPRVTFLHRLLYRLIYRLDLARANVKALESNARLSYLRETATRFFTLARVHTEALVYPWLARFNSGVRHSRAYMLEAIDKLHVQAAVDYAVKDCPVESVTLFRASRQPLGIVPDPTLGWNGLLKGHLEVHEIPAHHQNILKAPAVRVLAKELTACLDRARSRTTDKPALERKAS